MQGKEFEDLINIFTKFPGIGPRQARRFVYFLLAKNNNFKNDLIQNLQILEKKSTQCSRCHYWYIKKGNDNSRLCSRCNDMSLDRSMTMIVEKDVDVDNIIKTNTYKGLFFVLGGLKTSLIDKTPKYIRLSPLKNLLKNEGDDLKEIIIALSASHDGDNTTLFLKEELQTLGEEKDIIISSLGRGLSTGTELEYSDADTLSYALNGRK